MKDMKTRVIKVRAQTPDLDVLAEAAAVLRSGKVIAFPTETVYGLGALYRYPRAVDEIYEIKGRDKTKPFTFHIANYQFVSKFRFHHEREFRYFMRKFWPGPLTVLVKNSHDEVMGFRMPSHQVARILIELCGDPLFATSANISGNASPTSADQVLKELDGKIELLVDSGPSEAGKESSIVDLTVKPFKIVREGAGAAEIRKAVEEINAGTLPKFKVLFVCTGNTCRSPMAEAWFRHEIQKAGLGNKIEVDSCGIFAYKNMPAAQESALVLREEGIDLSKHSAKTLTPDLARESDLIYAMTTEHERFILQGFPYYSGKVKVMDVVDPIGMEFSVYRTVFKDIRDKLKKEIEWFQAVFK